MSGETENDIDVSRVEGKLNVRIGSEINCRDVDQLHISCFDCSKCHKKMSRKVNSNLIDYVLVLKFHEGRQQY